MFNLQNLPYEGNPIQNSLIKFPDAENAPLPIKEKRTPHAWGGIGPYPFRLSRTDDYATPYPW